MVIGATAATVVINSVLAGNIPTGLKRRDLPVAPIPQWGASHKITMRPRLRIICVMRPVVEKPVHSISAGSAPTVAKYIKRKRETIDALEDHFLFNIFGGN